ncbi:MAG: FAD/NAD(P)-binding protein [Pirellulales bacterium]
MIALLDQPPAHHPWVAHSARIVGIHSEVPNVATYDLAFDNPQVAAAYRFVPGQFNMLYLPGYGESAISISSDPSRRDLLSHTIRVAGNVTQAIAKKKVGDRIGVRGPFGSSWPVGNHAGMRGRCRGNDIVIACGGIGLAPLRPAIFHILNHRADYGRVVLLYGARTSKDLLYTSEFDAWRRGGMEVEVTVDIGDADWKGHIGVVPVLFYRLRLQPAQTTVMTCGPEIMMRFVVFEALARRIAAESIFLSLERNMSCGMGFCGHCQVGPYFVCKDGPVFDFSEVETFFNVEDL